MFTSPRCVWAAPGAAATSTSATLVSNVARNLLGLNCPSLHRCLTAGHSGSTRRVIDQTRPCGALRKRKEGRRRGATAESSSHGI